MKTIDITKIRIDGGTQMRAEINRDVVREYVEKMEAGEKFPPVMVFDDGENVWLADGFHRYHAALERGDELITIEKREGTLREAILYAVGANRSHGLPRTNADKRRAIETMLADKEWSGWSDREIGRECGVDHKTVGAVRLSLGKFPSDERSYRDRHGNTTTMNTANIGRREKTVINGDTGEVIDSPLIETVTVKPFSKPARDDSDDTGIGVVYRPGGNAPNAMKPIRGAVAPTAMTAINLPHDAMRAARAIIELFGEEYATSLAHSIASIASERES